MAGSAISIAWRAIPGSFLAVPGAAQFLIEILIRISTTQFLIEILIFLTIFGRPGRFLSYIGAS